MFEAVTFEQLAATLKAFGFEPVEQKGHVIFRHPKTGVVLSVPNLERLVRPIFVSTAARQLENVGIATASAFAAKLGGIGGRTIRATARGR